MPPKVSRQRSIASRIRQYLDEHHDVHWLTVPMLHRLGLFKDTPKRHEWEQALHLLNRSGDVAQGKKPTMPHCCGDCRATRYEVTRERRKPRVW